jgi:hypothetical protein
MNTDMLLAAAAGGLGLCLALALTHALRVIRYARSPRRRVHQRLSQLRR